MSSNNNTESVLDDNNESSSDSDSIISNVMSRNLSNSTNPEKDSTHQDINASREPHVDNSRSNPVEQHAVQPSTQTEKSPKFS